MEEQGNGRSSILERLRKETQGTAASASSSPDNPNPLTKAIADAALGIENKATGGTRIGGTRPTTDTVISPVIIEEEKIIKPKKTKPSQVLFSVNGRSFGTALPSGRMVRFQNGYLLTEDKEAIEYIRANAKVWGVAEEK